MPLMLALALAAPVPPPLPPVTAPRCRPGDLVVSIGGDPGDFNGMSHSGTLLKIDNSSRRACSVDGLPTIRLLDRNGRTLPVARKAPVGLHPGPVVVPLTIPAGQGATSALRWVSGPVYNPSRCHDATQASITINGAGRSIPLVAHLCGPATGRASFDQPVLTLPPR